MILTENEYHKTLIRLEKDKEVIAQQKTNMTQLGLDEEQIEKAIQPSLCFYNQMTEEVEVYEKLRRGDIEPINNITHIGRLLIGSRIALNMSQNDLAEKLGVSPAVISRDERNEYHGVTVEKAQRIFEALGVQITIKIDGPLPFAK